MLVKEGTGSCSEGCGRLGKGGFVECGLAGCLVKAENECLGNDPEVGICIIHNHGYDALDLTIRRVRGRESRHPTVYYTISQKPPRNYIPVARRAKAWQFKDDMTKFT